MIKVFLIDDEEPAISELQYMLQKYSGIEITGMYTDVFKALEDISLQKPGVIFLDIDMPGMDGMSMALRIQETDPDIHIVFVTAHSDYCLKAFELHALDYVLKPVPEERLKKTMDRIFEQKSLRKPEKATGSKIAISCFGKLELTRGGPVAAALKWRTGKAKEAFAYLLQHYGRTVSPQELIENIFPDMDEKKAVNNLYTTIYYIRRQLHDFGVADSEIQLRGSYTFEIAPGICDYVDFDRMLSSQRTIDSENIRDYERLLEGYKGAYMEEEAYEWSFETRHWLEREYEDILYDMAEYFSEKGSLKKAEGLLLRLIAVNPYSDKGNRLLLAIYRRQKNIIKYNSHREGYMKILREELNIKINK